MGGWDPVKRFNNTSFVAIFTPTDRLKSGRNRCVIEVFGGVFMLSESDLFLFLFDRLSTSTRRLTDRTTTRQNEGFAAISSFRLQLDAKTNKRHGRKLASNTTVFVYGRRRGYDNSSQNLYVPARTKIELVLPDSEYTDDGLSSQWVRIRSW